MMRFLTHGVSVLTVTMLLASPGFCFAAGGHGGGGHGGGGHGGGGHGSVGHGGGGHGGHIGRHGFRHGYYPGYGYGWGYYPWYGYGWGYYPWYGYGWGGCPRDGLGLPYPSDYVPASPPVSYQAFYPKQDAPTDPVNDCARLEVSVPATDAEIWLNGVRMKQTGTLRQYLSPPLKRAEDYAYDIRARWTENGQAIEKTQTVRVRATQQVKVDLANPVVATTAAKPPDKVAHVEVAVPVTDAEVWLNGVRMKQTGLNRQYNSPPLKAGETYTYDIRARWSENGKAVERSETIRVQASKRVKIDLSNPVIAAIQ